VHIQAFGEGGGVEVIKRRVFRGALKPRRGEILVEKNAEVKASAVGTKYISSLTGLAHSYQKTFYRYFIPTDAVKLTTMVFFTNKQDMAADERKWHRTRSGRRCDTERLLN
jgi:hypothetical protein